MSDSLLQTYETFNVPEEQRVWFPLWILLPEWWCGGVGDDPPPAQILHSKNRKRCRRECWLYISVCCTSGTAASWRNETNATASSLLETNRREGINSAALSRKEFDAINNKHKDGYVTKDELLEFESCGQVGEMDERDFNALFAAIDLDGSGKVDFMEFCAFMGKCYDDVESVKRRKSVVAARLSVRNIAGECLSMVGSHADNTGSIKAVREEEVEEKDEEEEV